VRFWLVHSQEVSLHEQIVRQVTLGVLSGELAPGERLPSIRELARRFKVHSNTVSAAYRQLSAERWVERRRGSGVYVRTRSARLAAPDRVPDRLPVRLPVRGQSLLDSLVQRTIQTSRELGITDEELQNRIMLALAHPSHCLLLEPDPELARLVQHEAAAAGCMPVEVCTIPIADWPSQLRSHVYGVRPVVLPSKADAAREALGSSVPLTVLRINAISPLVSQNLPVSRNHLVGIASHWPQFLDVARAMLIATGFSPDVLLIRDARERGWSEGLEQAASVICDSLTAARMPPNVTSIVFPLLSEDSLHSLRAGLPSARA
jgi:DNA-binding transcriptional regulator YhcF (GntR family)